MVDHHISFLAKHSPKFQLQGPYLCVLSRMPMMISDLFHFDTKFRCLNKAITQRKKCGILSCID